MAEHVQAQSSVRLYGASWKPLGNHTAKPYCRYTESKRIFLTGRMGLAKGECRIIYLGELDSIT